MARVSRIAGAIIAETAGDHYLIGNPKQPCDWRAAGFEPPGELDARVRPVVRLARCGDPVLAAPVLELEVELEGEALAMLLAERFVIARTGSVSERLWRLVTGQLDELDGEPHGTINGTIDPRAAVISARWLGELPAPVWQIVRDTVLRCT
ncbi:MAG TPA: hypothetical protein VGD37_10410 [Kofleriaceae bacterium]